MLAVGQCVKELAAEESAHAGGGDSPALSPERKQRDSTGSNSGGGGGGGGGSSGQGRAMSRPILLGNSLGGFIATKCAIGMPDAIGATVLISPGGAPLDAESLHRVHGIFAMKTLGDACRFVELVLGKEDNDIPFGTHSSLHTPSALLSRCLTRYPFITGVTLPSLFPPRRSATRTRLGGTRAQSATICAAHLQ